MCPLKSTSFYTHVFFFLDSEFLGVRRVPVAGKNLISWGPFLWSVVSSSACAFTWVRPLKHHQSAWRYLVCHNGECVFRMQMIKGFGGILGILVSCKDLWRQFTTGKSPIVILSCNIWVSIQPWVDDTGDIGTTRPTSHPRVIDSCVKGMLPSLLEQQMEESDYL